MGRIPVNIQHVHGWMSSERIKVGKRENARPRDASRLFFNVVASSLSHSMPDQELPDAGMEEVGRFQ